MSEPKPAPRRWTRKWTRRELLGAGARLGLAVPFAGLAAGCAGGSGEVGSSGGDTKAFEESGVDWKQFSGETIVFGGLQHPWVEALAPHLGTFTELTGINVEQDIQGEDQYVAKLPVRLSGGSTTPDVFMVFAYGQAVQSGWLEPVDGYLEDGKLTDRSWYDEDDVFESARQFVVWPEDEVTYGLPITAEAQTVFFRSDLLDGAPKTFEEARRAAEGAKSGDVAGIALRGMATADAVAWPAAGFVFSYDGYLIDPDGMPALDSPGTVAGVQEYADLIKAAGPKGVSTWSWLEVLSSMQQGQAAMMMDSSNAATDLLNPEKSRFADSIEAASFPEHRGLSLPNVWHWVAGINAKSEKKKAAWMFLQWATSLPTSRSVAANGGTPPRASAWEAPGFREAFGEQPAKVVRGELVDADSTRMKLAWHHPKWQQVGDAFARATNAALTGETSASSALKEAQTRAMEAVR